ncbi:MAG TPA: hypothetical protein PLD54_00290 [Candidatus Levybacteria bacterium]|nr:hypothetical protein [Candidatus Levybacteria bacterium]
MDNDNIPAGGQNPNQQEQERRHSTNPLNVWDNLNKIRRTGKKLKLGSTGRVLKIANTVTNFIPQVRAIKYIVIGIAIFILLIILAFMADGELNDYDNYLTAQPSPVPGTDDGTTPINQIPGLDLNLIGPAQVTNNEPITYVLEIQYSGTLDITIVNPIPSNTSFVTATGTHTSEGNAIIWKLSNNIPINPEGSATKNYSFTLTLQPTVPNVEVKNFFYAIAAQSTVPGSSNLTAILPTGLTFTEATDRAQQVVASLLTEQNIAIYKQAADTSGVPWEVLAAIHYREGNMSSNHSIVSGRPIGDHEPDVMGNDGCSTQYTRLTSNGTCVFDSLLNSALYAANLLKIKNGGNFPDNYRDLVKTLSYYNGTGNTNCGKTPYPYCPPEFPMEDHSYTMNLLDAKHEVMYVVYCADFTPCNPPVRDQRTGALSGIIGITRFYTQ